MPNPDDIRNIEDIRSGNKLSGARLIQLIEKSDPRAFKLLKALYPDAGNAFIIGITGAPGVGKSTLIDGLIETFREMDFKVAVICVDPTSPYSGGAILGDRLRMQRHVTDKGVFIRSMASRGHKGGLSRTTKDCSIVLDAMGYDIIIIESVGAGQAEFDMIKLAHSIGVVSIPGAGDGIQAVKAGILETADIFIVNKSDRPDADAAAESLKMMVNMRSFPQTQLLPKVYKTNALDKTGIKAVATAFLSHLKFMRQNGELTRKKNELERVYFQSLLEDLVMEKVFESMAVSKEVEAAVKRIGSHEINPISAAEEIADKILGV